MLSPKKKKNGPEDLMGHHGEVGLRWQAGKLKRKPEITYGLQRSTGRNEMCQKRKKIVFAIFSNSRKWDQNQKF
jgi:hypothetical protein